MLNLLFVEASLGLVPGRTLRHPAVTRNARREGKKPEETLLDRTLHHHAMHELPEGEKKGRPDIIHFCLLEALGAPLNLEGNLHLGIHTLNGVSIDVNPDVSYPVMAIDSKHSWNAYSLRDRSPQRQMHP